MLNTSTNHSGFCGFTKTDLPFHGYFQTCQASQSWRCSNTIWWRMAAATRWELVFSAASATVLIFIFSWCIWRIRCCSLSDVMLPSRLSSSCSKNACIWMHLTLPARRFVQTYPTIGFPVNPPKSNCFIIFGIFWPIRPIPFWGPMARLQDLWPGTGLRSTIRCFWTGRLFLARPETQNPLNP